MTTLRYLARIFSRPCIHRIACGGSLDELRRLFGSADMGPLFASALSLREKFDLAYQSLRDKYRSEYIYKNAIATKLLLGRHSLLTATLLTELRAGSSKADIVLVNGTSSVYEIKSEYDSIERLQSQLASYRDLFDRIFVCSHESQLHKLERALPSHVGIVLLSNRYTLQTVREAASNMANVQPSMMFHSLRKDEYTKIIQDRIGPVPDVPATQYYEACHALFSRLPAEVAHDAMVLALRERSNVLKLVDFIGKLPRSLCAAGLYTPLSSTQQRTLLERLDSSASHV